MMNWLENFAGNFVLIESGMPSATVYRAGVAWGGVWNGAADGAARRLKGKWDTAEEACDAMESAIGEGPNSNQWWPRDGAWLRAKKGNLYTKVNNLTISVKPATSGNFYVVNSAGGILGCGGLTSWFSTEKEATAASDELIGQRGDWAWVRRAG
jgi:hypothetical protein